VSLRFHKYQALGNDYIVLERAAVGDGLSPAQLRRGRRVGAAGPVRR